MLGWETIPAVEVDADDNQCRLWEIAENLHRADLSEAERRQYTAEWVRIVAAKTGEKQRDEMRHGAAHRGVSREHAAQPAEQGIRKAAKELGIDERSVRRAVAAESLPEPVKAASVSAGISDNQSANRR